MFEIYFDQSNVSSSFPFKYFCCLKGVSKLCSHLLKPSYEKIAHNIEARL